MELLIAHKWRTMTHNSAKKVGRFQSAIELAEKSLSILKSIESSNLDIVQKFLEIVKENE
jgi:hypothetical protein